MKRKRKPSDAERACLDEINAFEFEATADLLKEFGVEASITPPSPSASDRCPDEAPNARPRRHKHPRSG